MWEKKFIAVVIATGLGTVVLFVLIYFVFFGSSTINDNYFINSDSRIVSTSAIPSKKLAYGATKIHKVYEVNGEEVKSYKLYYEFENSREASQKIEEVKRKVLEDTAMVSAEQNGKYIIITMSDAFYKGNTASGIRRVVEESEKHNYIDTPAPPQITDATEPIEQLDEKEE